MQDFIAHVPASLASKMRHPFEFENWKPQNLHRSVCKVNCNIFKIDSTRERKWLCVVYQDWWQLHPQQEIDAFLWQEHASTSSAASSDVFALVPGMQRTKRATIEPVGALWLEKVMKNWRAPYWMERELIQYTGAWVLYIWKSHIKYAFNFVLQVLLLDKNIELMILRTREIRQN